GTWVSCDVQRKRIRVPRSPASGFALLTYLLSVGRPSRACGKKGMTKSSGCLLHVIAEPQTFGRLYEEPLICLGSKASPLLIRRDQFGEDAASPFWRSSGASACQKGGGTLARGHRRNPQPSCMTNSSCGPLGCRGTIV